jgi:hypothetical protein
MKFFFTLTLATIFSSAFSQAIDPFAKAIEMQNLPIHSEKIDYKADHSGLFEYVPDFLLKASEEDLTRIFSATNFERFSVTGVGIVYEKKKGKEISKEEISEIVKQISLNRGKLSEVNKEKPNVLVNNWFEFEERSMLWASGLVVVFRNKQLTHVWFDFK